MADSYAARIDAAERALVQARAECDRLYPGSREWESARQKVEEWHAVIRDLRREWLGVEA